MSVALSLLLALPPGGLQEAQAVRPETQEAAAGSLLQPPVGNVVTPSRASIITGSYGFGVRRDNGPLTPVGGMDPLVLIGGIGPASGPDMDDEPTTLPFRVPTPFWGPREWVLGPSFDVGFTSGYWYIADTSPFGTIWKNNYGGVFAGQFYVAPSGQVVHSHPHGWGNGAEMWSVLPFHDDYTAHDIDMALLAEHAWEEPQSSGGGDPHGGCTLTAELPGAPPCFEASGVTYVARSGCTELAAISPKTGARFLICNPGGSECKLWISCGMGTSGFYCTECDHPGLAGVSFSFSPGGDSSWCGYPDGC